MSCSREALVALAEAVRLLHATPDALTAVRTVLPLLGKMLQAEGCCLLRPAAPCLWLGSWEPAARSGVAPNSGAESAPALSWELFCPIGRSDELDLALRRGVESMELTFRRSKGFGEAEMRLMLLFLGHLAMAAGGAEARSGGDWALRVSDAGELGPVEPEVVLVLQRYWPDRSGAVPAELRRWLAAQLPRRRNWPAGMPGPAWVAAQPWGRLHVQLEWENRDAAVLRGWEERGAADFRRLRSRGLTERECEVVFWLAQGKRDAEIGVILAAAPKTIGKHVEHVLTKLGAESRATAAATAKAWLEEAARDGD